MFICVLDFGVVDDNNNNRNERSNSTFLQSPHWAANSLTCMLKWPGRNQVQIMCSIIERLSRATCCVLCDVKGQLSY